jgi:hypothetical protein
LIQAQALRGSRAQLRPLAGILAMVSRALLKSVRLAPSTARPLGTPPPSVSTRRLVPILPRAVGFLPTVFPHNGGVGPGPFHRQPFPVKPLQGLVGHQTTPPQLAEDPSRRPLLATAMSRATAANVDGMQGIPLATGREHVEEHIHRPADQRGEAEGILGGAVCAAGATARCAPTTCPEYARHGGRSHRRYS